jgi:hypothetical protein
MKRAIFSGLAGVVICGISQASLINEMSAHDMAMQARADQQNVNNNGDNRIAVGGTSTNNDFSVPILRWTLSTVPGGETASTDGTITLTIWPFGDNAPSIGKTVNVYRIKAANAGWLEDQATWNDRITSTPWNGGPGLGNPGDGYDAAPLSTFSYTGASTVSINVPQATVNDWIANPSDNAGIILIMQALDGTERFMRFYQNNDSNGPMLAFETVPEPGSLLMLSVGGLLIGRRVRRA